MTTIRTATAGLALILALTMLAGCSDSGAEDARTDIEQADAELAEARERLEDAEQAKAEAEAREEIEAAAADKREAERRQAEARDDSDADTGQAQAETGGTGETAAREQEPVCGDCGTVQSITPVTRNAQSGSGVGAVAGGVAGAVVGSQIGSGSGKTIAQIAGTLGGAFAGNEAEKRIRKETYYQVEVAMDAGGSRRVDVATADTIDTGTRVRVQGNNLVLMR